MKELIYRTDGSSEKWKDVPEYEGLYQVSNFGRVKSLKFNKQRILKLTSDPNGYYRCNLYSKGKRGRFKVHKLVAISFLGHVPDGHNIVVDHVNNDKSNNRLENLQLISHRENTSKDKKGYSSQYVGVTWNKSTSKWLSRIVIEGELKYLGSFTYEIEAAEAYQTKLKELKKQ